MILTYGDTIGIIAVSNGLDTSAERKMKELEKHLQEYGLQVAWPKYLYKKESVRNASGKERAEQLMTYFKNKEVKAIFDVSGGDIANEVLSYLDFEVIKENPKPFFGYSDVSVIVNALYAKAGMSTYLYQLKHLVGECQAFQLPAFNDTFMKGKQTLFDFQYEWIQGKQMEGVVIGGNIRCFLKLAGTPYMPDCKNKILFLESYSGDVAKMITYLTHYKQLGVFEGINGLIVGSFTEMEQQAYTPHIVSLVQEIIDNPQLPIIKTNEIGHQHDSKCLVIGRKIKLEMV